MGHFRLFSKYGQKLPFITHFDPPKELRRKFLIVTNFIPTNKEYLKTNLMQNETNLWSRFNVWRSFVTMATNLPFCFFIQLLEQLLKFLANFTLLKYVKSQRSYGLLITTKLIFGFQILDLKVHFSASLIEGLWQATNYIWTQGRFRPYAKSRHRFTIKNMTKLP